MKWWAREVNLAATNSSGEEDSDDDEDGHEVGDVVASPNPEEVSSSSRFWPFRIMETCEICNVSHFLVEILPRATLNDMVSWKSTLPLIDAVWNPILSGTGY